MEETIFELTDGQKEGMMRPHIQEELNIFLWCYKKLYDHLGGVWEIKNRDEIRVVHDCFLLHSRNLIDFLWNDPYQDDILAFHYGVSLPKINDKKFSNIKTRINKQLSHITLSRLNNQELMTETEYIHKTISNAIKDYNDKINNDRYRLKT